MLVIITYKKETGGRSYRVVGRSQKYLLSVVGERERVDFSHFEDEVCHDTICLHGWAEYLY